ncbi:glutathione S-transferase [Variovorax sp. RB2P76]|uniref:glutathione S-transferase n=1 Tax=Variovorax sp. RB2P76 TaxID=3443736 RepID=UPI003F447A07
MKLQLFHAPTSPYVRKVMATAALLGLADRIERLPSAAHPVRRDDRIAGFNPLAKVPAALSDDGQPLYDSRVICEYLDHAGGGLLFPAPGPARWRALMLQALGDGLLDAALLARYERTARPDAVQSQGWYDAQLTKIGHALDAIEREAPVLSVDAPGIGEVTLGCALGYLDFRFAALPWREGRPQAAAWFARFDATPAMAATRPHD